MAFADLFPPLVGSQLEAWYRDNIEPGVLRELANAPAQRQAQLQNEIWQAFRTEQGSSGKNAAQFTAERAQLQARYAGLARSKASQAAAAPPERLPPANPDQASAEEIYQRIYTSLRTGGDEAASRAAASAGKQAFLAARANGADLWEATRSASTVAQQTYNARRGTGGGVTPPPNGGGTTGLPDLPPLDAGGGAGLPDLPPLDAGGGGGLPNLPALDNETGGLPTTPAAGMSKQLADVEAMFSVQQMLPAIVAQVPWGEIIGWITGSDDPEAQGFFRSLMAAMFGRPQSANFNAQNCNLMANMYTRDFPQGALAVAYFQCGVTNPIGLDSREAQAVWHALNLVTSGVIIEADPSGGCSCRMRHNTSGMRTGTRR